MRSNLTGSSPSSFSSIKGADAGKGQDRHLNAQIKFLSSLILCACVNPRGLLWVPWRQYGFSCFTNNNYWKVFPLILNLGRNLFFCLHKKWGRKKLLLMSVPVNWESQTAPGGVWEKPNAKISFSIVNVFTLANRTAHAPIQKLFTSAFRKYLCMQRY